MECSSVGWRRAYVACHPDDPSRRHGRWAHQSLRATLLFEEVVRFEHRAAVRPNSGPPRLDWGSIGLNEMIRTMDEKFLTVAEVAETLRLNPQTIRNWI